MMHRGRCLVFPHLPRCLNGKGCVVRNPYQRDASKWQVRERRRKAKMDITKLSNSGLREFYEIMIRREKSCAKNPQEEEEYQTQAADWQDLFKDIEGEMIRRKLI